MPTSEISQLRGGAWLIEPTDAREVLTPERLKAMIDGYYAARGLDGQGRPADGSLADLQLS